MRVAMNSGNSGSELRYKRMAFGVAQKEPVRLDEDGMR